MSERLRARLALDEQVEYYRARAPEYDKWFARSGRYDRGAEASRRWSAEVEEARAVLDQVPIDGVEVLELAGGTGIWTERLVARAGHLTVVDASPEMLERNKQRLARRSSLVEYVVADLFEWEPERPADALVAAFWVSHVPRRVLDSFLARVAGMLKPGGALFFLDSRREQSSTALDHTLPREGDEVMVRKLDDGREFHVVKNFWGPGELVERCLAAGLEVAVTQTATYFWYAVGRRGVR